MGRTLADSLRWMQQGTALVAGALGPLDEQSLEGPSSLPGWTRKHVVAHLSANAYALGNLVHWAATGEVTPMYASMEQRNADIEAGAQLPAAELNAWFTRSATALDTAMGALTDAQWAVEVLTAQGRTVPASETAWMRTREVMVHAVDLDAGVSFDDLPAGFLAALCDEIAAKRSGAPGPAVALEAQDAGLHWEIAGEGDPAGVVGTLAAVAAYLAGRSGGALSTSGGGAVPELPAWL